MADTGKKLLKGFKAFSTISTPLVEKFCFPQPKEDLQEELPQTKVIAATEEELTAELQKEQKKLEGLFYSQLAEIENSFQKQAKELKQTSSASSRS